MTTWRWIGASVVYAIQDRQPSEHGGLDGIRDRGAVESALARSENRIAYGEPEAADLAASYAYGLAQNHGFADGNKRTTWVVARLFLADNVVCLVLDRLEAVANMKAIAAGECSETKFADWFRQRIPLQTNRA